MAAPVIMPKFEMSQESATIVEWLKGDGDRVEAGEPVLIVETDKITMEVESPATGILAGIRGEPNQAIPVTEIVAYVLEPGERLPGGEASVPPAAVSGTRPTETDGAVLVTVGGTGKEAAFNSVYGATVLASRSVFDLSKVRATPAARRIAREQAMDLGSVVGSGPRGRVLAADVAARGPVTDTAASSIGAGVEAEAVEARPMSGLWRTTAQRMAASHQATARVTLVTEVDASDFVAAQAQLEADVRETWGSAPDYNDLLAFIVARALRESPYMNVRLSADGQSIEWFSNVGLGIAVDTEGGLLVPVIRDADRKTLRVVAAELRALIGRARAGRSLPDDLRGGTFTITNLGMFGIDAFTPIINLPEAAILGVGRIRPKPVVHAGETAIRQMWTLSMAFDHRLVDGAPAARFLQRVKQLVENPFLLLG